MELELVLDTVVCDAEVWILVGKDGRVGGLGGEGPLPLLFCETIVAIIPSG